MDSLLNEFTVAAIGGVLTALFISALGLNSAQPKGFRTRQYLNKNNHLETNSVKLLGLNSEPIRMKLLWLKIFMIFSSSVTLAFSILISAGIVATRSYSWDVTAAFVLFFLPITGISVYMTIDLFKMERKVKNGGITRIGKSARILIKTDYMSLIHRCVLTLADMEARLVDVNPQTGNILAILGNDKLNVEIRKNDKSSWAVLITSDSTLPTVRVGGNRQLKNTSMFTNRFFLS